MKKLIMGEAKSLLLPVYNYSYSGSTGSKSAFMNMDWTQIYHIVHMSLIIEITCS